MDRFSILLKKPAPLSAPKRIDINLAGPRSHQQSLSIDATNSSTANLNAENNYTFTGAAMSTLNVARIQETLEYGNNLLSSVMPDSVTPMMRTLYNQFRRSM